MSVSKSGETHFIVLKGEYISVDYQFRSLLSYIQFYLSFTFLGNYKLT